EGEAPHRVISAETAGKLSSMLTAVVQTGTGSNAAVPGYLAAGKTGTARKPLDGARGYKAGAYVSSFAGFVPAEKPALTAIVVLDEPTPIYGGTVSAPVFAQITRYGLREFTVPPPPPGSSRAPVPAANPSAANTAGEAIVPVSAATTQPALTGPTTTPPRKSKP
ncbi:MAG: hypothetical protein QOG64_764, partial [Acidimicrobiaceae bacterium]|nr:hypothetical protein [Acidimicrobiaceae bacterium]